MGTFYLKSALARKFDLPEVHARALFGLGLHTWMSGDSQSAVSYMHKSLDIWRKLDIPGELAIALAEISEPLLHTGERDASLKYIEEALEIARELGNPGLVNHCHTYYSINLVHTKQYKKGKPMVEELLLSSKERNNNYGIETALHLLGDSAVGMKDYLEGEKRYAEGIKASLKYGTMLYTAFDTQGIAFALAGQGRWAKAIRLDAAARELFKKMGVVVDGMVGFWDEWIETYIEGAKKKLGKELTMQYQEEGIKMGFEKAVVYALDFNKD
jgi:tetratricopeptide (TPR) repeat protein